MAHKQYKLRASLHHHENDVRAVAILSNDCFATASRDKTVCLWKNIDSEFKVASKFLAHSKYVNALASFPASDDYPDGLVVSAGSDKLIMAYEPSNQEAQSSSMEPQFTLIGHDNNVCTLAVHSQFDALRVISGSWDNKAIVWKNFVQEHVLEGHSAAVWAVLAVDDHTVLTGSADKTIRLWKGKQQIWSKSNHTDAVRGLALVPGIGFVSCSNDGTLRVWTMEGEVVQEMEGHTAYVYSVAVLSSGEFVSSGEDRTVRIWKDGECIQIIQMPCTSVWTVAVLPNDDIVVGGSDAVVRVFTRADDRMASEEEQKQLEEQVANQTIPSNQIGEVDKSSLPGREALSQPGKKEGQVIMVNVGGMIEAHQWDAQRQTWQKIGEVVGGAKSGDKKSHEGQEYDYVFDIDVEDGKGYLKLPYNIKENPTDAAQNFILKNNLPQEYLEQIVDFILKNTERVEIGGNYNDPYTGGNQYVPQQEAYNGPVSGDPFTGDMAYDAAGQSTAKKARSSILPYEKYLPMGKADVGKITAKFSSFNEELGNVSVESELSSLSKAIGTRTVDEAGLKVIIRACMEWPSQKRFPAIDLLRLSILYDPASVAKNLPNENIVEFLCAVGGLCGIKEKEDKIDANIMLAYRGLANLFVRGESLVLGHENALVECIKEAKGFKGKPPTHEAIGALALNLAVFCAKKDDEGLVEKQGEGLQSDLLTYLLSLLETESNKESLYLLLLASGTLVHSSVICRKKAKECGLHGILSDLQKSSSLSTRESNVIDDIRDLLV